MAITSLTVKRLLFGKKTIFLLFLCAIPIIISLFWLTTDDKNGYGFFSVIVYVAFLFFIVVIIALLYGIALFNDDFTDKTITYLISRPVDRAELVLYKYIGYLISAIVLIIPPLVIMFAIVASKAGDVGNNIDILFSFIAIFILAIVGYGAVFMFFGLLFKRPLLISFVYMFVWESTVAQIPLLINQLTLRHYLDSITFDLIDAAGGNGVTNPAETATAGGIILAAALFFLILSCILARKKDFA